MATFCIVSPARWARPTDIKAAADIIEARGHTVIRHPQNEATEGGRLAGTDQQRASALMDAFKDDAVDIVLAARGGQGALRILPLLDWQIIKQHPKKFCGFSDITVLLNALNRLSGIETFHGPVATTLGDNPAADKDFFDTLTGGKSEWRAAQAVVHRPGQATGRLVGGNLTLLQAVIGTPYDWNADNAILLIEETSEALYRVDRMLSHLKLAGKLESVKGVILGESKIPDGTGTERHTETYPYGRSITRILDDWFPPNIPIVTNFPSGHGDYNTTLPIGVPMSLRAEAGNVRVSRI